MTTIVWFRRDLRLTNNPALQSALSTKQPIVLLFILDSSMPWFNGAASRVWLHHSLSSLQASLRDRGTTLVFRKGGTVAELDRLASECGANRILWNREYEPASIAVAARVKEHFKGRVGCDSFNGRLLIEPFEFANKSGNPFKVFTPFWKKLRTTYTGESMVSAPSRIPSPPDMPVSESLDGLGLLTGRAWEKRVAAQWAIGEQAAQRRLAAFIEGGLGDYDEQRNYPAIDGVSRLSPHLHFGELDVQQVWHNVHLVGDDRARLSPAEHVYAWLRQLAWREFAYHLLFHYPHTVTQPLNEKFAAMPWTVDPDLTKRWQRGLTGYPLVDAGMRELWQTGWMHNRVRMVVASFLTKHIGSSWQVGAEWFWDTLFDADLANNTLGWQWVAGCGADAAPYYRIFNPTLQSQKFDRNGDYIRRWVPELDKLNDRDIHEPHRNGVTVADYPPPCVDHRNAREAALARYQAIR